MKLMPNLSSVRRQRNLKNFLNRLDEKKLSDPGSIQIMTFLKFLGIIAFWEMAIMILLESMHIQSPLLEAVLDTFLLTISSGLSIWVVVLLPIFRRKTPEPIFFQQIIQAIDHIAIISIANYNGKRNFVNDNLCKLTGYSESELLGTDDHFVQSSYHDKELTDKIWKTLKLGKPWRGEMQCKKKNGELYWVDSFIHPFFNEKNELENLISFQFDITEDKLASAALEEEKIKNIHLSRLTAIGEMASGIAHEINNPLAVIMGFVASIEQKLQSTEVLIEIPKVLEMISKIKRQALRITKIISGLRQFSRTDVGRESEFIKTHDLMEAVENLCSEKIKERGVKLEIQYDEFEIKCNAIQVEQVLINLIGNSLDAIQKYDEKWIRVECRQRGDFAEFSVTDSGPGIPESLVKKIMVPFFTTKEIGKGTGLGLSISKQIIEGHGGTLVVDTQSQNTRFVFQIALTEAGLLDLIDAEQAISSHMAWRQVLLDFLNSPNANLDIEKLSTSSQCSLGKWLDKIKSSYSNNNNYNELNQAHKALHLCAGEVARKIKAGDPSITELTLGSGSEFDRLSKKVIANLQALKVSSKKEAA